MTTYAIFSALYHPHMGGVEAYTAGLAGELAARGHRVLVVTSRLSKDAPAHEMQPDGVEVFRLPCQPLMGGRLPIPNRNADYKGILSELKRAGVERVVLNNHFYEHTMEGAAFAREIGAQALVIEHGSAYLTMGNAAADAAIRAYEHGMANRLKSFGFPFAAVSGKARDWARTFGIECVGVVPNALDADGFSSQAREWSYRDELGLTADDLLVASVGRLVPEKGVDSLLEAANLVHEGAVTDVGAGRKCLFAFAGDGPMISEVRRAGDNVVALGRLDASEVAALLRDCDAYVLPSRSEGFATSLLEACAMGAFPISTDVGGVEELGIGSVGGVVLPDASAASVVAALEVVAADRAACKGQGAMLQSRVRERGWPYSADELERAFEQGGESAQGDDAPFEGDERLDQLHRVLLMMLKDFAAICQRENIQWMAHYGTAIGALRHGGFIPWDDDLDIIMMREDHDRFVAAVKADASGKYSIVDAETYPGYPLATTRLILNGTEFRDSALATMDFPSGIFLDLFPLDAFADDERAFKEQVLGSWFFNKLAIAKLTKKPFIAASGVTATAMSAAAKTARVALNLPGVRAADPNKVAKKIALKYRGVQTRRVGYSFDTDPFSCMYDRDDLLPVRWVPFEDMEIPVPNKVEQQLTDFYGDWMTPPPGDQRKGHYPDVLDFGDYADV